MPYRVDKIDPSKTVMIVVDMQNDFVAEGAALRSAQAAAMVPKLAATLEFCRGKGIRVIYTAHVHRRDGSDMGMYDDLYPPIADRSCLVDETKGIEIFGDLTPAPGEHVIREAPLQCLLCHGSRPHPPGMGHQAVVISGTTTENCCHATARDALFNNYQVVFLSDVTGTFDYPDVGQGSLSAEEVHRSTLTVLAFSTAHVMTAEEFKSRVTVVAHSSANKAA